MSVSLFSISLLSPVSLCSVLSLSLCQCSHSPIFRAWVVVVPCGKASGKPFAHVEAPFFSTGPIRRAIVSPSLLLHHHELFTRRDSFEKSEGERRPARRFGIMWRAVVNMHIAPLSLSKIHSHNTHAFRMSSTKPHTHTATCLYQSCKLSIRS